MDVLRSIVFFIRKFLKYKQVKYFKGVIKYSRILVYIKFLYLEIQLVSKELDLLFEVLQGKIFSFVWVYFKILLIIGFSYFI